VFVEVRQVGNILPTKSREHVVAGVKQTYRILFLMACGTFLVSGCGREKTKFVREIADTDNIAFVNDFGATNAIKNRDEVNKFIQAVKSAKRDKNMYAAVFESRLRFQKGTNVLGEIRFQDRAFWIGKEQYSDTTHLLSDLYTGQRR
jgi:hypothetical protein